MFLEEIEFFLKTSVVNVATLLLSPPHYPVCDILILRYSCGTVFNSSMRQTYQQDTPRKVIHFYSIASTIFRVSLLCYLLSAFLGDTLQQKSEKSDMTY